MTEFTVQKYRALAVFSAKYRVLAAAASYRLPLQGEGRSMILPAAAEAEHEHLWVRYPSSL